MRMLATDPVGLPALAALGVGSLAFLIALVAARVRGSRDAASADARRNRASVYWIALQGIGIGAAGFGPVRVVLDPLSVGAIVQALVVLALMVAAVWLFDASSRALGRNWALIARTRQDGTLVQSGPFAAVRNPIYVALFLVLLAIAIGYGHSRNLVVAMPLFALGTWMRVAHEERVLRDAFGSAFDTYAARVRRFVPGVL